MDETDLEEVDEEAQQEDHEHHDRQDPVSPEGQPLEEVLDQVVAVEPAEDKPEAVGAHQDDEGQARDPRGRLRDGAKHRQREAALDHREDQPARRAHGGASVGEAIPAKIEPSTPTISTSAGSSAMTTRLTASPRNAASSWAGMGGARCGFQRERIRR